MEEPVSPLVLTKLGVPTVRSHRVARPRLIDLLTPQNRASLVLVCAPAGYGKTTLLAEWAEALRKQGAAIAWYALDAGDDDPIPFRSYLIASFIQALGPLPELVQIAQMLRSAPELTLLRILPAVIQAIAASSQTCVLILDDYHLISSPAIHNALVYLLGHLPDNLQLAVGSRSDPPLPLARLRVSGRLLEVRAASLRFTIAETTQFLNAVMRLDLSASGVAALEERTEGWVAGLQLAALSLQDRSDKEDLITAFSGSHRYLVDYLLEEVVNRLPAAVQAFLLATSILERMCAPLCDALLLDQGEGSQDATPPANAAPQVRTCQQILEHLESANLFLIPLDRAGQWYRYHHLFRDFLQTRLTKTQPEQVRRLHRAAGAWLAAHAFLREAAGHVFQTHDWEDAAAFVEQYGFTLIIHSEISTLYEWCAVFPEEAMQRHPMLCLLQSLALAYGFRRQNRDSVKARLRQVEQVIATLEDRQLARGLIDMAGVVRTFLAFAPDPAADPRELLALGQSILDAYPHGDPAQFSGLLVLGYAYLALHEAQAAQRALEAARQIALRERMYFGVVEATFHLARLAHSQGQLRRAAEICRQGQADIAAVLAHPERELPALGCLDVALGCVLLEQDRLEEAERHLRLGLDRMGGGMNPYYLMTAYVALFRLGEVQGRSVEALTYLDRLETAWPDVAFCTQGLRVMQALRRAPDDPATRAEAAGWSQSFAAACGDQASPPGMGPCGAAEGYYLASLACFRARIALGEAFATRPYLERQLEWAATHGLTYREIELSLLAALASRSQGDLQGADAALEHALSLAQPEGYIRSFDQGPALTRLLSEAAARAAGGRQPSLKEYIEQILAATGAPPAWAREGAGSAPRRAQAPARESLSERELEVLRLVAQGATNHEIAARLVITVGTVKSHINHILGKLDAHNRTEAVARARNLGLLEV